MLFRLILVATLFPAAALAQQQTTQDLIQSMPDDIDPSIFIGAPLLSNDEKYELTKAPRFQFQSTDFVVIEGGDVKDNAGWTDADTAACEASGGEALPLPAGRTMCFRF